MSAKPIDLPYVSPEIRHHWSLKHCYERKIAYAVQMRGDDDDMPVIIYYGAPMALVRDVMQQMQRMTKGIVSHYVVRHEHSCRYKNGKAYRRIAVEVHGLNEQCMSLNDLTLVIGHYMQKVCWCTVKELPLRKLLNL